jgi:hypothetical protein
MDVSDGKYFYIHHKIISRIFPQQVRRRTEIFPELPKRLQIYFATAVIRMVNREPHIFIN